MDRRGQSHIVGQEHQSFADFRVYETDAPQLSEIALRNAENVRRDALVADDANTSVALHQIYSACNHVALGAGHEEYPRLMQSKRPVEFRTTPIRHIERPTLVDPMSSRVCSLTQRRMPDRRTKIHAIPPRLIGRQTGYDVAQTLARNQLCEGHGAELIDAYHEF